MVSECAINIIRKNIKASDQEKRKINRNRDNIQEVLNQRTLQKKRKETLVQEGGAFLAPLTHTHPWKFNGSLLERYHKRIND